MPGRPTTCTATATWRDAPRPAGSRSCPTRISMPSGRPRAPRRAGWAHCRPHPRPRLDSAPMRPDSLLIRGPGDPEHGGALAGPRSLDVVRALVEPHVAVRARGLADGGRGGSPARRARGGARAAFASGMTAWSSLCFAVPRRTRSRDPRPGYYEVELLAAGPLTALGVEVRRYSPTDPDGFATACQGARLALIETPANPLMHVVDLDRAGARCACRRRPPVLRQHRATPLLQQPLSMARTSPGRARPSTSPVASDAIAGVLSVRDDALAGDLTRRARGCRRHPRPDRRLAVAPRAAHAPVSGWSASARAPRSLPAASRAPGGEARPVRRPARTIPATTRAPGRCTAATAACCFALPTASAPTVEVGLA